MLFLHIDMTQVVEIFPQVRWEFIYTTSVNIISADQVVTQGARASTSMILTMLNQIDSNPAR